MKQTYLICQANMNSHNNLAVSRVLLHQKIQIKTIWKAFKVLYNFLNYLKDQFHA